ncbi:cell wall metabolism sensor histidine kinase WalK [Neobacillus mesonae]|uniref:sensor histidine kinase n=1 Tax=Neobacillus mesonae TaxID=1193713 RepID=UPI0020410F02|nr:ATP-binding protein [Neobacillus mesonae]MCM3571333.1 ATP-binding protein [Neobacillus mesonae]
MFNKVKTRLTVLYTISLVLLLFSFIGILYFLISHEINDKEIEELKSYFIKEQDDFYEDLYEENHHGLKNDHERTIFYYLFDKSGTFISGKEANEGFLQWIDNNFKIKTMPDNIRVNKGSRHFLLMKQSLGTNGFILLGKEITAEKHLIEKMTWILFVLTILFSLIFALLGYYFAGQAMKPIRRAFEKQEKFVSDASHELRTPISIFYSSVDLLMTEEKDHLSPIGREVLYDVKQEAMLMNKLVNDLLELARSDKNQLNFVIKEVNLSELLTGVFTRFLRKKPIQIEFEQEIQQGIIYPCDEVRIQQLIYILLDNAFRFTKAGKVTLGLEAANGTIVIKILDTGCGIASEDLPYIFDRFYRADQMREKGGAGLGLSIAKIIAEGNGGKITAASKVGAGSVFTITFKQEKGSS